MSSASRGVTAAFLLLLMVANLYGEPGDPVDRAVTAFVQLLPSQ